MDPDKYFGYMRETTIAVDKRIRELIEPFHEIDRNLFEELIYHPNRRMMHGSPQIKPNFVRLGYEACAGQNWEKIIPACAAVELANLSWYVVDRIIDEKGGAWTKSKADSEMIISIVLRNLAYQSLDRLEFSSGTINQTKSLLNEMNQHISLYQYFDNKILLTDNIHMFPTIESYLTTYERKCYHVGGLFYGNCLKIGALLAGANPEQTQMLAEFGKHFGTAFQIVHEVGDLIPESQKDHAEQFKYYQDQYNSVRRKKLTFPIYLALKQWRTINGDVFHEMLDSAEGENMTKITELLASKKVLKYCRRFTKKYVKEAKKSISLLPESNCKKLLLATTSGITNNIFWKALKNMRCPCSLSSKNTCIVCGSLAAKSRPGASQHILANLPKLKQ